MRFLDKSANITPFTSYINERLEGLDPHHRRVAEQRLTLVVDQVEQEQEQSCAFFSSYLQPTATELASTRVLLHLYFVCFILFICTEW